MRIGASLFCRDHAQEECTSAMARRQTVSFFLELSTINFELLNAFLS